jgi:hypothetical protein
MQHDKKTRALEAFRQGCTWEEVATACNVSRTTLWRWSRSDDDFAAAIEEAKADPDIEVEAVTFQNACNPDPAHNTLRMFWLKSRMPRTYKERLDVTSKGDLPVMTVYILDKDRQAELDGWAHQYVRAKADRMEREKVLAERASKQNETDGNPSISEFMSTEIQASIVH